MDSAYLSGGDEKQAATDISISNPPEIRQNVPKYCLELLIPAI